MMVVAIVVDVFVAGVMIMMIAMVVDVFVAGVMIIMMAIMLAMVIDVIVRFVTGVMMMAMVMVVGLNVTGVIRTMRRGRRMVRRMMMGRGMVRSTVAVDVIATSDDFSRRSRRKGGKNESNENFELHVCLGYRTMGGSV